MRNAHQLQHLRAEHRELDDSIAKLVTNPNADPLTLRRMKKRKLQLKDMISQIEGSRLRNLNA